jgi:hypothetical protein
MRLNQHDIDLATRVQRRRDFTAHVTGFLSGAIALGCLLLAGVSGTSLYAATLLTWATALSFQHFRHVLRGPVTAAAVQAEATRLSAAEGPDTGPDRCGSTRITSS